MSQQLAPIPLYQKEGRVWMQRTEGNVYFPLSQHGISSIVWPAAAPSAIRAQSNRVRAGNIVIDITLGDTELPTFSIPTRLFQTRNYLVGIASGEFVNVQVHTGPGGSPTQYSGSKYGIGWVLCMRGTGNSDVGAVQDNAGEGVPVSYETPFTAVIGPIPIDWTMALALKTETSIYAANGIFALPSLPAEEPSRRILEGEVFFYVTDGAVAASGEVYYTKDGRITPMVQTAADPFGVNIHLKSVVAYGDKLSPRVIVAADTQAAAPSQIAYSDDYGATWNIVSMGAVNADQANRLWIVDASNIYGAGGQAASSKIWRSTTGGATWTEIDPALSQPLRDICVMGNGFGIAAGDANVVTVCTDFDDFSTVTGPAAGAGDTNLAVAIKNSTGTIYMGNDAGELYKSDDRGASWTTVTTAIQGFTATAINRIKFDPSGEFGYMEITTAADRRILRTTDGGTTWTDYSLTMGGLSNIAQNDLHVIGPNHIISCGALNAAVPSLLVGQSNFDGMRQK